MSLNKRGVAYATAALFFFVGSTHLAVADPCADILDQQKHVASKMDRPANANEFCSEAKTYVALNETLISYLNRDVCLPAGSSKKPGTQALVAKTRKETAIIKKDMQNKGCK